MPRTLTAPPTDRTMWRRLLRLAHPDQGGDHDLFVWVGFLRELIAGDGIEDPPRDPPPHPTTGERLDYTEAFNRADSFVGLTRVAVLYADEMPEPYAELLRMLRDCYEVDPDDAILHRQQHQGATYKTLAAIAYRARMSRPERMRWYRIAESIPLSQRHAGHIMARLGQRAA